jgi:eukaryotic-like serine/threonine-protein kinase
MLLEAGKVIDGKYRLTRLIGTGGMGAVYEGENVLIRRKVAIKVLHTGSTGNADAVRRFEREAQAAGEIGNDHILEVLDLGSLPNGDRYLVMEYLDGETLAARIERHGHLTPEQIAPIARQFLTALTSAHAAGIIHRDLKPENIFILRSKAGRSDFVKLIDFGISKFSRPFTEGEHRMTRADAVLGTPCYMSPEQARGAAETDVRSDIYSCGVILYEAVTGRLPFEGESFNDLMFKIALSEAPSPTSFVPTLDPDFAEIITHAIARAPAERFASAQEFSAALEAWMLKSMSSETLATLAIEPVAEATTSPGHPSHADKASPTLSLDEEIDSLEFQKTGTEESWARSKADTPVKAARRRGILAVVSGAALLLVGIGIAMLVRTPRASRPPVPAVSTPVAAVAPAPAVDPTATPADALPTLAPEPSTGASTWAPRLRRDPGSRPGPVAHPPPPPPPQAAGSAEKPKPKPAPSAKGFDLGY